MTNCVEWAAPMCFVVSELLGGINQYRFHNIHNSQKGQFDTITFTAAALDESISCDFILSVGMRS